MKDIKVIFLDVDGVLNSVNTNDIIGCYIGIDSNKVRLLKKIVERSGSYIVLSSTWKKSWYKGENNKKYQDKYSNYLDKKINDEGMSIFDKTNDNNSWQRGLGIVNYIKDLEKDNEFKVKNILIIDDCGYDFEDLSLDKYWLETDFYEDGLTEDRLNEAIAILNTPFYLKENK